MAIVLGLSVVSVAGWGVYRYLAAENAPSAETGEAAASSQAPDASAEPLDLASKPQISDTLPVGGKLTGPQISKAVTPSIVGVVQYQPDMYLNETGEGSGIIMSADGYVITNEHVVREGRAFKVVLPDGTPYDADLIGSDPQTDLAVLKIKGVTNLTPAVFGDSTQIEVGEPAFVIGNPGGKILAGSITRGIISAVDRESPGTDFTIKLIQTDAAINPGNSGGALVNEYGQVIGIPSSKLVAQGFEGICFAIPITEAKPIIDDIVANGRVTGRVKLGINAQPIDEIDARNYGLMVGIRIVDIAPDSDLVNTSVQRFDIITHIDGERVTDTASLKRILDRYRPGDVVTLRLFRPITQSRSDTFDVEITLQEA
jgi:serine protease Do